jgi:putative tricarboxylic transport membrane protein
MELRNCPGADPWASRDEGGPSGEMDQKREVGLGEGRGREERTFSRWKRGEVIFFGLSSAFFLFMSFEALGQLGHGRPGEMGSGVWPLIALSACLGLSGLQVYLSWKSSAKALSPPEEVLESKPRRKELVLAVVVFALYLLAIPWLGFFLSTFLFVPAVSWALGERRTRVLVLGAIVVTGAILGLFGWFISIPFPKGVGIFASLSRLLH